MSAGLLSAQKLSKSFGMVEVLTNITFELEPGEIHAFIGENGAGKSTLMKILGGYLEPSDGELTMEGQPLIFHSSAQAEAKGIVLIHQELNLAEDLTVEENIFLGRERHRGPFVKRKEMVNSARDLLSSLETDVNPREHVKNLSVSQKQMVEIAKAVARDARILIMDEPTDVLTGRETEVLFGLMRRLQAQGVTIIYISHKLDEVKAVSDRVSVLRDGQLITTAPTETLSEDEMANLMVGRELSELFPEKLEPAAQTLFAGQNLSVQSWAQDITFDLHRGEILGFAGLVGAGRTELFEGVMGLRPMSGTLYRNGHQVRVNSPRQAADLGIVYLSEDRKGKGILVDMPLQPNVTLLALERFATPFIDKKAERKALERGVETFDVRAPNLRSYARELSGGNQQKIVLAKIMEIDPDIIILDEPTRGIDIGTKRQIYFFIQELTRQGKACILISSELPEIIGLCHRVLVMRSGKQMGILSGDDLREDVIVRYATGLERQESGYAVHA